MANLITNPGFETNTTGWDSNSSTFTNSGATLTRITTDFYAGTACADVTYTSALNQQGINTRSFTFAASTQYLAYAWIRWKSGPLVRIRVRDWNNGTAVIASSPFCVAVDQWQYVSVIFTTGASAGASANNTFSVVTDTTAAAGEFYVDQLSLDTYTGQDSCGILIG